METRKLEEINFHDKLRDSQFEQRWSLEAEEKWKNDSMWTNMKYYSVERKSVKFMRRWLEQNCSNKKVLDFGCGNGEESIFVAKKGAEKVIGIDISPVSIDNCRKRSNQEGLSEKTEFYVVDGEALRWRNNSFDLAMEYGALHHVDLDLSMREISRVLKEDGKMICTEALGHNPLIHMYRKMTPHLRTKWEVDHIIRKESFNILSRHFNKIELHFFHLATIAAVPFRKIRGFKLILSALEAIDQILLKLPLIKWQAWQIVFVLSEPNKVKNQHEKRV